MSWSSPACCLAIAISRAVSIPKCGRIIWRRRRWSWLTPWPAGSTSTSPPSRSARTPRAQPVFLKDIWPTQQEVLNAVRQSVQAGDVHTAFTRTYSRAMTTGANCRCPPAICTPGSRKAPMSSIRPYFENMPPRARADRGHSRGSRPGRCSATVSRRITFRRPGRSRRTAPPANILISKGVQPAEFNSYGARRGNHEVMVRGTFANVRLKNKLAPGTEGGFTRHLARRRSR